MSTFDPVLAGPEPEWLRQARQLVGLREIVGSRHEKKVLDFFVEAGHPEVHDDETAWCAAFANAMLRRAGQAGTGALNARSFLTWGTKLDAPQLGCIVVFKRGNAWQGHVGFFLRDLGDTIEVLSGNTGNAVAIARFSKATLLGYRWPVIKSVVQKPAVPEVKTDLIKPRRFENITATIFSSGVEEIGAYGAFDPRKPGVALPFRFKGAARPRVRVFYNGKSVDCDVIDVGPWSIDDQYWSTTSGRPRSETQLREGANNFAGRRVSNDAGIDLTPGAAIALGLVGKGKVAWQFIDAKPGKSTDGETAAGAVIATGTTTAVSAAWSTGDFVMLAIALVGGLAILAGFCLWIYRRRNGRFPWQRQAPAPSVAIGGERSPGMIGPIAPAPIGVLSPEQVREIEAALPATADPAPGFLAQAVAEAQPAPPRPARKAASRRKPKPRSKAPAKKTRASGVPKRKQGGSR